MKVLLQFTIFCAIFLFAKGTEKVHVDETSHPHKEHLKSCEAEESVTARECHDSWLEHKDIEKMPEKCPCLASCVVEKLQLLKDGDRTDGEFDSDKIAEFIESLGEDTEINKKYKEYVMDRFDKCKESYAGHKGCAAGKEMIKCFRKHDPQQ